MTERALVLGFDCPEHGLELNGFCHRALEPALRGRWIWLQGELERAGDPPDDADVERARWWLLEAI